MKNYAVFTGAVVVTLSTIIIPAAVFAEEKPIPPDRPREFRTMMQERSEQVREEVRAKIDEHHQENIISIAMRVNDILNRSITKLESFGERIQNFVTERNNADKDTGDAQKKINEAEAALDAARTKTASLVTDIEEAIADDTSREEIRTFMRDIRTNLVAAKDAYIAALKELKISSESN